MGIVLYHARVDQSTLETLLANPDLFWELPDQPNLAAAQRLFTDKDWEAISWLLSAKAREEQKHRVVGFSLRFRKDGAEPAGRAAWKVAKVEEAAKRGLQLVETDSMPDEPPLMAIQGRGPKHSKSLQMGLHAQTFEPDQVAVLSAALDQITETDLHEHFDPKIMESLDVAGILWTEEEPDVFEKILIPTFEHIRQLFRLAAQAAQYVLVVIT